MCDPFFNESRVIPSANVLKVFSFSGTSILRQRLKAIHRKKKVREFPVPSRDVTTKLSLGGNNDVITEFSLPRGSLVSDIPAGDGKLVNLFLRCRGVILIGVSLTLAGGEAMIISAMEAFKGVNQRDTGCLSRGCRSAARHSQF
jgi:hypothetical protein